MRPHSTSRRRTRSVRAALAGLAVLLTLALVPVATVTPAHALKRHDWGRLWAPDGVLRAGCHDYPYRYHLRPPPGDWSVEIFLKDRRGRNVASDAIAEGQNPKRGKRFLRVCRVNTVPGRFILRGKMTVDNGPEVKRVAWIKPAFFRLRRP